MPNPNNLTFDHGEDVTVQQVEEFTAPTENLFRNNRARTVNELLNAAGPEIRWTNAFAGTAAQEAPVPVRPKRATTKEDKVPSSVRDVYGLRISSAIDKILQQHKGEVVVGVELEIENFPVARGEAESTGFDFTDDGSLRNNGIEAVSRPNSIKGTLAVVKNLWSKYDIKEKNFSDRTSIHVHANVTHFNYDQLRNLVLLYCVFEDILFDLVGEERRDNIFCVPWSQCGLHTGNYSRVWTHASGWQKYTALNLRPVADRGTVEFRHMYGHANFELLATWLGVIEDLMTYSEKADNAALFDRVINLNTSSEYGKFFSEVFASTHGALMESSPEWNSHMIRGVIEAKLSTYNF